MTRTREFYLYLLELAFIDIRATASEGNQTLGPKIADMFHNVPGALCLPWTEERENRVYTQIRAKADVHGLTEKLDRWEKYAQRREQECRQTPALAE